MKRISAFCLSLSLAAMWAMCLQPMSSHAETETEWIVGLEAGFGNLDISGSATRTTTDTSTNTANNLDSSGGGGGVFVRYNALFPSDWILGVQFNLSIENYDDFATGQGVLIGGDIDTTVLDFLLRASYDTGRVRPFVVMGPTFHSGSDWWVEDDYLSGFKIGFGADITLESYVVSIGYYYSTYAEKDNEGGPFSDPDLSGEWGADVSAGRVSVGYRF